MYKMDLSYKKNWKTKAKFTRQLASPEIKLS